MSCVLTLALDEGSQERFEALRQQWFPPERNQIPAHLTLFHSLPDTGNTSALLETVAQGTAKFAIRVTEVRSLGRGVAFFLSAPEAISVQKQLRSAFLDVLSPQDRQGFRPHVVVQNKVESAVAKEALAVLQADFTPWTCQAMGFDLWRYLGGPWEHLQRYAFTA